MNDPKAYLCFLGAVPLMVCLPQIKKRSPWFLPVWIAPFRYGISWNDAAMSLGKTMGVLCVTETFMLHEDR